MQHSVSKQWRPCSDTVLCSVWSGSALFAFVPQKDARLIWVKTLQMVLDLRMEIFFLKAHTKTRQNNKIKKKFVLYLAQLSQRLAWWADSI